MKKIILMGVMMFSFSAMASTYSKADCLFIQMKIDKAILNSKRELKEYYQAHCSDVFDEVEADLNYVLEEATPESLKESGSPVGPGSGW